MSTALYRRYRPETFAELIGQAQVTTPLMTALRNDRVNHAYLFSGPRGCGKTTSARILARCLNCAEGPTDTPCGKCASCIELARDGSGSLDVVEIDAASHNGVDDARELRERAAFAPVRDRYKIFILDEAHMVTTQGFNALLKIVEEPPEHVKFIFATTEPEKVIGTIRSRTHHYPFRLVPPAQLLDYLEQLVKSEKVSVAPGVLSLVVRAGGGSVRDSLSLLDQLIAGAEGGKVEYDLAAALLGFTHESLLDEIVDAFATHDAGGVFGAIDRVIESGQDPRRFVEDLLERLRDLIVISAIGDGAQAVMRGMAPDVLAKLQNQALRFGNAGLTHAAQTINAGLNEMSGATSPKIMLELMCGKVLVPVSDATEVGSLARIERLERRIGFGEAAPAAPASAPASAPVAPAPSAAKVAAPAAAVAPVAAAARPAVGDVTVTQLRSSWPAILELVKTNSRNAWMIANTLEVVDYAADVLTLLFKSQKDLETFKSAGQAPDVVRNAIRDTLGVVVKFKPQIAGVETAPAPTAAPIATPAPVVEATPPPPTEAITVADEIEEVVPEQPKPAPKKAPAKPKATAAKVEPVAEPETKPEAKKPAAKAPAKAAEKPADDGQFGEHLLKEMLGAEPIKNPKASK
jgi:DNA polymerase-3 subunit gamma/tau